MRPMPRFRDDLEGGTLVLEAQYELDSSPVSDAEDDRFGWLVGTLRGVFGDDVVVAPELLTGELSKTWPQPELRVDRLN